MEKSIFKNEYKKVIGRLKTARREAGFTQVEVAKILKTNQSIISKIEIGERRVDIIELKFFAELYKKNITYFINEDQ